SALDKLREVCERVAEEYDVVGLAAVHRVGSLDIGDVAVGVATTSAHRGDAFAASRALIDTLKTEVPIWKHQRFGDGTEEWVGTPQHVRARGRGAPYLRGVEILSWLRPAAVATVVAMLWAAWAGRAGRGE